MKRFTFLFAIIFMLGFNGVNSNAEVQKEVLTVSYACCKICTKGKACGNTCIEKPKLAIPRRDVRAMVRLAI